MQLDKDLPGIPWKTALDYVHKAFYNDRPICFNLIQAAAIEFERDVFSRLQEIRETYVADLEMTIQLCESTRKTLKEIRRTIENTIFSHPDSPYNTGRVITGKQLVIELQTANIEAINALNDLKRGLKSTRLQATAKGLTRFTGDRVSQMVRHS